MKSIDKEGTIILKVIVAILPYSFIMCFIIYAGVIWKANDPNPSIWAQLAFLLIILYIIYLGYNKAKKIVEASTMIDMIATRRKYYLHTKVKGICTVNTKTKHIYMAPSSYESLTGKTKEYIKELQVDFGYTIQLQIPD